MKNIIIVLFAVLALACSGPKKLHKTYVGKPVSELQAKFGKPVTVFDQKDGKMYVFEKTEELESTEISQGKLTLDPIVTPKVVKTERYYATVKDGVVVKIKMEEEYER